MTRHHLTDTELLGLHFDQRRGGDAHEHLDGCVTCQARGRAVTELLSEVDRAAADEADALFGPEALAKQHARIMGRIAHESRSARIISFPAASAPPERPAKTGTRWVAAHINGAPVSGRAPRIVFAPEDRLSGSGGCNTLSAVYEAQAGAIAVRALGATERACDEAVMRQEGAFLALLAKAARYEHDNARLVLADETGRSIEFTPAV